MIALGLDIPFSVKQQELQKNGVRVVDGHLTRGEVGRKFMRITLDDVEYRYQVNTLLNI